MWNGLQLAFGRNNRKPQTNRSGDAKPSPGAQPRHLAVHSGIDQYSSASMMVMMRSVTDGSDASGEW